ncbi:hypothetical protein [Anatilimnocola floriformis]|uniref:hypothetical protein n=1 Tax=Anatilimnocola floriformis TaxID=2948575 RepID=UPI0020C38B21|nr:hypothetical protein [Anatilimnocola floriformis]
MFNRIAAVILLCCIAGCSGQPRLKIAKVDDVHAEVTRVAATLEPAAAAEFTTAAEVLAMHAALSATTDNAKLLAPVSALNGKTPAAIVAEYKKLPADLQLRYGREISAARSESDWQRASRLLAEIMRSPGYADNLPLLTAVANVNRISVDEKRPDKWTADQFAKGIDYLITEYGPDSKYGP